MSQIISGVESTDPWCFVRFVDGRIDTLQVDHELSDPLTQAARLERLRASLSTALRQHHAAQLEQLTASDSRDPGRRRALAFVDEQLQAAKDAVPLPRRRWFPAQADGRDTTGRVHASVTVDEIVILEAATQALLDPLEASTTGIREAINLALSRLGDDVTRYIKRFGTERAEPPDWAALAVLADEAR